MPTTDEPTVAILGCGPAGLMAAHACALSGVRHAVFSKPQHSVLGGAQFLHSPIPGLTDQLPEAVVNYCVIGDAATYQAKAYGQGHQPSFVSFDNVLNRSTQPAWNLVSAYSKLWDAYEKTINDFTVKAEHMTDGTFDQFDLVISSIPRPFLCKQQSSSPADQMPNGHVFNYQTIKIMPGQCFVPDSWHGGPSNMHIFYNGSPDQSWYRSCNLWGYRFTEFGGHLSLPYQDMVPARKPLTHNCDCHSDTDKLMFVGRYGKWQKGVLAHTAYFETRNLLS